MPNSLTLVLLLHLFIHYSKLRLVNTEGVPETLHRIVNNDVIRNALDSFTMSRRETYTHTPKFGHSKRANIVDYVVEEKIVYPKDVIRTEVTNYASISKLDKRYLNKKSDSDQIEHHTPIVYTFTPEYSRNDKKAMRVNIEGKDVNNLFSDIIRSESMTKTNHQNNKQIKILDENIFPKIDEFSNDQQLKDRKDRINELLNKHMEEGKTEKGKYLPEISRALHKQIGLINALRKPADSNSEDEHFLDIMESIDKKKRTKAPTTMVMIDQIDVRQALYNDPLVRRILKLTQRKNKQMRA